MSFWTRFKDPVSGGTHLAGAAIGAIASLHLVSRAENARSATAFLIFGISLVLLYLASSAYHLLHVSEKSQRLLRRLDHSMIFVFIAGSYTPYCLITLHGTTGDTVLIAIWAFALLGTFVKIFWLHAPRALSTVLYLIMGWVALSILGPLSRGLSPAGFAWLVAGGLCYTFGAVVYAIKRPDPFPTVFGFHEIWHLFVLGGSTCHYFSVATLA